MIKGSKHSKETLKKIGLSGKGRVPWNKDKKMKDLIPNYINPNKGKIVSLDTRKKSSESHKKFYKTKKGKKIKEKLKIFHKKRMNDLYKTKAGDKLKETLRNWNKKHNKEHTQKMIDNGHYKRLSKKNSKTLKKYFSTPEGKEQHRKGRIKGGKKMKIWYNTPAGIKKRKEQSIFARKLVQNSGQKKYKILYNKKFIYMRSKAEIAVAKYLIKNNKKFIYEGKINTFQLSETHFYINDFYLPAEKLYIQVKGNYVGTYYIDNGLKKFNVVCKLYPEKNFELWDIKKMRKLGVDYK